MGTFGSCFCLQFFSGWEFLKFINLNEYHKIKKNKKKSLTFKKKFNVLQLFTKSVNNVVVVLN